MYWDRGRIWSKQKRPEPVLALHPSLKSGETGYITCVELADTGNHAAVGDSWGHLWVYDLNNNRYSHLAPAKASTHTPITSMCFFESNPGGHDPVYLVIARTNRLQRKCTLEIIDVSSTVQVVNVVVDHRALSGITRIRISGDRVVTGSSDSVIIWEFSNGSCIDKLSTIRRPETCLIISFEMNYAIVVILFADGALRYYDHDGTLIASSEVRGVTELGLVSLNIFHDTLYIGKTSDCGGFELERYPLVSDQDNTTTNQSHTSRINGKKAKQVKFVSESIVAVLSPTDGQVSVYDISLDPPVVMGSTEFVTHQLGLSGAIAGFAVSDEYIVVHESSRKLSLISLKYLMKGDTISSDVSDLGITETNRMQTYVSYFQLPLNQTAFAFLQDNDPDLVLAERIEWESRLIPAGTSEGTTNHLNQLLDCLALLSVWRGDLEADFSKNSAPNSLAANVFPFVKLFWKSNRIFTFELIVSFISNFCSSHTQVLPLLEQCDDNDKKLYLHLHALGDPAESLLSHTCECLFSTIWPRDSWLRLIDHFAFFFRNSCRNTVPLFLPERVLVEYLISRRSYIMQNLHSGSELQSWLNQLHEDSISPAEVSRLFTKVMGRLAVKKSSERRRPFVISETCNAYPNPTVEPKEPANEDDTKK